MADERIVVRATLRDRLSRPLRDIEEQALRTSAALRTMCGVEGCLDHVEGKATDLQRRIRALGQETDKVKRKTDGLATTQEKVAGAVDRATGSSERLTATQARLKRRLDQSIRATGQHRSALGRFAKAGGDARQAIESVGASAIRHRDHLGRFARSTDSVTGSTVRARDALGRFTRITDESGQAAERTSDDIDRLLGRIDRLHDAANRPVEPWWSRPPAPIPPAVSEAAAGGGGMGGGLPRRDARGRFTRGGGSPVDVGMPDLLDDVARGSSRVMRLFGGLSRVFSMGARGADAAADGIGSVTGMLGRLKKALPGAGGGGRGGGIFRLLKGFAMLALLPAVVGPAASALSALGAGAVAALQALAPLSGVIVALPAAILALGTSMAAIKMAFSGIGEAVSVLNDPLATADQVNAAMAKLTPEARAFARQLHTMKPAMDDMRATVQRGLFPGFSDALDGISTLLPTITRGMGALGRSLGQVGFQAGELFRNSAFQSDVGTIMDGNARMAGKMGSALVHLLSALRHVMVAAGPFVDYIGDLVLAFGRWAEASAATNRANGDTARFLEKTQQRMGQFGRIIRDFAVAWGNIFSLATPMADEGTRSLESMAAGFRAWTESAGGVEKISGFFDAMRPVLVELGGLLKDATFGILTLGQTSAPGTVTLLQTLRDMGPALRTLFEAAHESGILTSVVSILGSFAQVLSLVYGPLGPVLSLLATLAGWIAKLAADTGPAGSAFRGLITVILWGALAMKAMGLAITIVSGIMGAFRTILMVTRGAMLLLNLAMIANPIGAVVALVALLVGGLVLLYNKSETARKVMDAMGRALRWAFDNLTPLGLVIKHFDKIRDAVSAVVDWIKRIKWPSPPGWVKSVFGMGDTRRPMRAVVERSAAAVGDTRQPVVVPLQRSAVAVGDTRAPVEDRPRRRRRSPLGLGEGAGRFVNNTLAAHAMLERSVPGRRRITSLQRTDALGSEKSDHRYGRAIDLQGPGLNTYARLVKEQGGYAAFHGTGPTRHLHVVPPPADAALRQTAAVGRMRALDGMKRASGAFSGARRALGIGDTTRPRGDVQREYRMTPHVTRPLAVGDTLAPRAREAVMQKVASSVTVSEGAIIVQNPASDIDLRRAIADGLADYERERRERA